MASEELLKFVGGIEDIVDIVRVVKPVVSYTYDKKKLYVELENELYLYELELLNKNFKNLTGSLYDDVSFFEMDEDNNKLIIMKL